MAQLSLSIQLAPDAGESPADRRQLRRWAHAALACDAALTLRLVGEEEARTLNAQFRGRDYATNVLTFAYDDDADDATPQDGPLQADIVICLPVVAREAREQGKAVHDHLAHLIVHGVLHAQGMDHEMPAEAQAMEDLEIAVLRRFRIGNPYLV
jgi:probable rRNA maturation factor